MRAERVHFCKRHCIASVHEALLCVRPSRSGDRERGRCVERATGAIALTLVVHKVEQFVLFDGPTQAGAVLLQIDRRLWQRRRVESVASIEGSRVKCVAARLYAGVDNGAWLPPVFRLWILLGIEFLDGVDGQGRGRIASGDGRIENTRARIRIIFPHTVQQIANVLRAGPVG